VAWLASRGEWSLPVATSQKLSEVQEIAIRRYGEKTEIEDKAVTVHGNQYDRKHRSKREARPAAR